MPDKLIKVKRIIIEGITESGDKFRPSDWAERICGYLASFENRRFAYSSQLRPGVDTKSRAKCLVLDPRLKETNPGFFEYIMKFAADNHLKIHESYEEAE